MAANKMEILLGLQDKASPNLKKAKKNFDVFSKTSTNAFVSLAAKVYLAEKAFRVFFGTVKKVSSALIVVASKVENLNTRLVVLLGSAAKGNQVFKDMADLAGRVPKTYDEIMESATNLAGVVKDGVKEINQLMPIIVDISAATGLSVQETTSQIIRMYSAGAAAADMFRQQGISAALGFKAGVFITNEETMAVLTKQWEDGTGKFVGASEALATTWLGMTSMMEDAWFQFKKDIGAEAFESIKIDMAAVLKIIKESKEEGGKYGEVIENLSKFFDDAYNSVIDFALGSIVASGQIRDGWNEVLFIIKSIEGAASLLSQTVAEAAIGMAETPLIGKLMGSKEDIESAKAELLALQLHTGEIAAEVEGLLILSQQDFSTEIRNQVDAFTELLELKREELEIQEQKKQITEEQNEITDRQKAKILTIAEIQKTMAKDMEKVRKSMEKAFAGTLSDIVTGAKDADQAMKDLGKALIKIIVDTVAEWIIAQTVGKALQAVTHGITVLFASSLAAAWAPAAVLASIATAGGATAAGMTAMAGATMATPALQASMAALSMSGGSAGGLAGGTDSVPAMLSPGEGVIPATFMNAISTGRLSLSGGGGGAGTQVNIEINNPILSNINDIDTLAEEIANRINDETERI